MEKYEPGTPNWKRGLSVVQHEACQQLLLVLRDDLEESTTYRTRNCIIALGLVPLPDSKLIASLLLLSRGNDLAFLYFLMESYYKTTNACYSINEQIIMSAICYLDLPIILHELDRILPAGHRLRVAQKNNTNVEHSAKMQMQRKTKSYASPYFQKQPRPAFALNTLSTAGRRFISNTSAQPAALSLRNENMRITKKMPNAKRWFAEYELNPQKRIMQRILHEEINKLFEHVDTLGNAEASNRFHPHRDSTERQSFIIKTEDSVQQLFDVAEDQQQLAAKLRVGELLQKSVDFYIRKYLRQHNDLHTAAKAENKLCRQQAMHLICQSDDHEDDVKVGCITDTCIADELHNFPKTGNAIFQKIMRAYRHLTRYRATQDEKCNCTIKSIGQACADELFFEMPTASGSPHGFNYATIFKNSNAPAAVTHSHIGENIVAALYANVDVAEILESQERANVWAAVEYCVQNIWQKKTAAFARIYAEVETARQGKLYYARKYFDPYDEQLMTKMLKDALAILGKDHKLVLPTFPDVHKLPTLRLWIQQRYGRRYKPLTGLALDKFTNTFSKIKNMKYTELHYNTYRLEQHNWSYADLEQVKIKSEHIKHKHYTWLNDLIMRQTRQLFNTLELQCCHRPFAEQKFFAYLPASLGKITHRGGWIPRTQN